MGLAGGNVVHAAWVDDAVPVGVGHVTQARCSCGWEGTLGADHGEARMEMHAHRREVWAPTADDLAWLTGTGRYSQD